MKLMRDSWFMFVSDVNNNFLLQLLQLKEQIEKKENGSYGILIEEESGRIRAVRRELDKKNTFATEKQFFEFIKKQAEESAANLTPSEKKVVVHVVNLVLEASTAKANLTKIYLPGLLGNKGKNFLSDVTKTLNQAANIPTGANFIASSSTSNIGLTSQSNKTNLPKTFNQAANIPTGTNFIVSSSISNMGLTSQPNKANLPKTLNQAANIPTGTNFIASSSTSNMGLTSQPNKANLPKTLNQAANNPTGTNFIASSGTNNIGLTSQPNKANLIKNSSSSQNSTLNSTLNSASYSINKDVIGGNHHNGTGSSSHIGSGNLNISSSQIIPNTKEISDKKAPLLSNGSSTDQTNRVSDKNDQNGSKIQNKPSKKEKEVSAKNIEETKKYFIENYEMPDLLRSIRDDKDRMGLGLKALSMADYFKIKPNEVRLNHFKLEIFMDRLESLKEIIENPEFDVDKISEEDLLERGRKIISPKIDKKPPVNSGSGSQQIPPPPPPPPPMFGKNQPSGQGKKYSLDNVRDFFNSLDINVKKSRDEIETYKDLSKARDLNKTRNEKKGELNTLLFDEGHRALTCDFTTSDYKKIYKVWADSKEAYEKQIYEEIRSGDGVEGNQYYIIQQEGVKKNNGASLKTTQINNKYGRSLFKNYEKIKSSLNSIKINSKSLNNQTRKFGSLDNNAAEKYMESFNAFKESKENFRKLLSDFFDKLIYCASDQFEDLLEEQIKYLQKISGDSEVLDLKSGQNDINSISEYIINSLLTISLGSEDKREEMNLYKGFFEILGSQYEAIDEKYKQKLEEEKKIKITGSKNSNEEKPTPVQQLPNRKPVQTKFQANHREKEEFIRHSAAEYCIKLQIPTDPAAIVKYIQDTGIRINHIEPALAVLFLQKCDGHLFLSSKNTHTYTNNFGILSGKQDEFEEKLRQDAKINNQDFDELIKNFLSKK